MDALLHPDAALFHGEAPPPALPFCEHYAGSEKLIRKSFALQSELGPVFDVTCDCEDGAPRGGEVDHATMVGAAIASGDNRFLRAGLRIHDVTHPAWRVDLDIVLARAGDRVAYVTVPKVESAADARQVAEYLRSVERRLGLDRRIPLHFLIETHGGLREVHGIAAVEGAEALDFGLLDFVSSHFGVLPATTMHSPGQFEHALLVRAKAEVVAAAASRGLVASHNICTDIRDPDRAASDARRARREFGFLRMYSIHPSQILPIVEAMRPTADEVAEASGILLAAHGAAWGPIQHGGRMHDRASYRFYWAVLKSARAGGAAIPAAAVQTFFHS